ncbi:transitional endoplasmic reticulum ATPase [Halogranum amylolyticum]|uniref:Transitional endoplasmic reticulum ATPase n=1 Tax=Halogranum amylolyticum TaxID=660520 RepID=A0A1H8SNU9_9EURY|nr:CDC48 family AAA ATPase [Halogranum amylolyticum]SEO80392.1 transitional endoplasmic reticulum ATPase [Halogranum amylolyticum]
MSDETALELTVRGAEKRDAGRGIARLPEGARQRLGVLSGDTVVIEGERETVAKVWPARGGAGEGSIQIDADTRTNAGVKISETVRVRQQAVDEAVAVTLAAPDDLGYDDADLVRQSVKRDLQDRPLHQGERVRIERLGGSAFVVTKTVPDGTVRVTDDTNVTVTRKSKASETVSKAVDSVTGGGSTSETEDRTGVTYEDIGGLDEELDLVREMIELPLSEPEVFARLGIEPPKGVLLHGPPGTGKTLIAKAVANEVDATFITVSGPEIMSKYKGESEEKLREKFEEAEANSPAIVFFDEIDSIAGKRDDGGDVENRVVGQLLTLMDGLDARGDLIVIGATNRVDSLDPALRRGGRFDREIEIGVPGETGRREILDVHIRRMPLAEDVDVDRIASRTHGFVGADLESLAKEAAMTALRRVRRDGERVPLDELEVTRSDFEAAMASVEPSAMREYVAETPTTTFENVGGLQDAKDTLERAVTWPLTYAPLFESANTEPPSGVLLYGPPGTGKTLLARAIAGESGVNFIHVAGPELLDRYVGESEKAVREVFERARQAAPAIVFFDEIDAVATSRDSMGSDSGVGERVVSQLLTELDRLTDNPNLVVLAATNRRDALDPALLRPGRLESHVEVPAPDHAARRAILGVHTRDKPLADDVDLDELAGQLEGYSGADLTAICREAAMSAIREVADAYETPEEANEHRDEVLIRRDHFDAAVESVRPSLGAV